MSFLVISGNKHRFLELTHISGTDWTWLVLCILTSFWVMRTPKSWSNNFFSGFNLFCSLLSSMNPTLKHFKVVWLAFRCAQHPKAGRNTQQTRHGHAKSNFKSFFFYFAYVALITHPLSPKLSSYPFLSTPNQPQPTPTFYPKPFLPSARLFLLISSCLLLGRNNNKSFPFLAIAGGN